MKRYHSQGSVRQRRDCIRVWRQFGEHGKQVNWDSRHPLDCGRTSCHICHCDKLLDRKDVKIRRAMVEEREQLKEFNCCGDDDLNEFLDRCVSA